MAQLYQQATQFRTAPFPAIPMCRFLPLLFRLIDYILELYKNISFIDYASRAMIHTFQKNKGCVSAEMDSIFTVKKESRQKTS
ncbi:MAG: hypothetical protein ACU83N_06710 [Gammaproteobacteria bacterium]